MPDISKPKRSWRYYRNLTIVAILGLIIGIYTVIPISDAVRAMHPTRYRIGSVSPADLGMSFTNVTLSTQDGLKLYGWYVPSTNGAAVILVHAFNGNRTGTLYHAALLAKHGYGVLLYDTRSEGESEGGLYALGWDAHQDVMAALEYLQRRPEVDPKRIGVLGFSAGARIALQAAAETHTIAAVAAEGPGYPTFEDWCSIARGSDWIWAPGMWVTYTTIKAATGIWNPMPLKQAVARIAPTPLYLIAAGNDRNQSRVYFKAAGEPKTIWERQEPGHIDALFKHPEEYEQRIIGFFDQA